jgi:molybdopterin-guanine dinucleotide biosynthesis protein A
VTRASGGGGAEGFVLAGGRSTRMGRDKASLEVAGRPLVEHMLAKLRSVGLRARVAGAQVDLTKFAEVTADAFPGCGPLAGIEAALRATDAQRNLCVAVDLPLLPAAWLRYLLERAEATGAAATIPYAGGRPQPLCAVYRRELLPLVSGALQAGDYKVMRVMEAAALALDSEWGIDRFDCERIWPALAGVDPPVTVGDAFLNCNGPEDLELVAVRLERTANGGWPQGAAHPRMP